MKQRHRRSYRFGTYSALLGAALFLVTCLPASATTIETTQTISVAPAYLGVGGWVTFPPSHSPALRPTALGPVTCSPTGLRVFRRTGLLPLR